MYHHTHNWALTYIIDIYFRQNNKTYFFKYDETLKIHMIKLVTANFILMAITVRTANVM